MRKKYGFPEDGFLTGMVGANSSYPSRKSIPEALMAWKRWIDEGRDGMFYLHTSLTPKGRADYGIDLPAVLDKIGLDWSTLDDPDKERRERARVILPSQYKLWCGCYDDHEMAELTNMMDVLLEPSMAEGFGLPIVEAQSCGVPVVTLKNTSMPELTFAGKCLEPLQEVWDVVGGFRHVAPIDGIFDAMVWASEVSDKERAELALLGRMSTAVFDWKEIVKDHFLPFLEDIESEL